jgi:hypothetical protein
MGLRRYDIGLIGKCMVLVRNLSTTFGGEHLIYHSAKTLVNIGFRCTLDPVGWRRLCKVLPFRWQGRSSFSVIAWRFH